MYFLKHCNFAFHVSLHYFFSPKVVQTCTGSYNPEGADKEVRASAAKFSFGIKSTAGKPIEGPGRTFLLFFSWGGKGRFVGLKMNENLLVEIYDFIIKF